MKIGKVIGQVVATAHLQEMPSCSLLLVEIISSDGNPTGESHIAMDPLGAGEGEWVVLTGGSAARAAFGPQAPVDLAIVGIIDQLSAQGRAVYNKT